MGEAGRITVWHWAAVALGSLVVARPGTALAYRPFDGTDAAVAARGDLELEIGPVGFLRSGQRDFLVMPTLVVNWGVADRWELVLEGKGFLALGPNPPSPSYGLEESGLFAKAVLREGSLQQRDGPSIATEFGALLPNVNGPPGAGAQLAVIASQRWPALTLHLNGAVAWTRAHALGLFGGLILEGHDAWALRPVAEIFVDWEGGVPATVSGLAGAIWRAADDLSFDAGVRLARTGGWNTVEVRAGLTWSFSVGFPKAGR